MNNSYVPGIAIRHAALEAARANGYVDVGVGSYLHTQENILAEQEGWDEEDGSKNVDFTTAPYWITTDSGTAPIAVYGADDPDLVLALAESEAA